MIRTSLILLEAVYFKPQTIKFVRWGDINPVKQKGYKKGDTFHASPARKGIYAFVWPLIERFLIPQSTFDQSRMTWVRRKDGSKISYDDTDLEAEKWKKSGKRLIPVSEAPKGRKLKRAMKGMHQSEPGSVKYLVTMKKPKTFTYKGPIWHHLESYVSEKDIIDRNGGWIKTGYKAWAKALGRERGDEAAFLRRERMRHSKDHLEVFIERP